jgi:uncharacterized protein YxeA
MSNYDSTTPDFGDIKVTRAGTSRTSNPGSNQLRTAPPVRTGSPVVTTSIVPEVIAPKKRSLARFWWLPVLAVLGISAAVWGRNYYQHRYVGTDFWAQVSETQELTPVQRRGMDGEIIEDMWGVDYRVTGVNAAGDSREFEFVSRGEDTSRMPQPGSWVVMSVNADNLVRNQHVVPESEVPANVLAALRH